MASAHRAYAAGERVRVGIGSGLSTSDQLLDFGHVGPDYCDYPARYDAAPGDVAPPRGSRNSGLLAALAALQGAGVQLSLGSGGPDVTARTWVRAALAPDAELVRAGWRVKAGPRDVELACRVMGRLSQPRSAAGEAAMLQAFAAFAGTALAAYPSSLEEDLAALAAAGTPWLECQVLRALASEKRALVATQEAVQQWQQALQQGVSVEQLYGDEEEEEGEEGW